jgi:AAA domain
MAEQTTEHEASVTNNGHRPEAAESALYSSLTDIEQTMLLSLEYKERVLALVAVAADPVYGGIHILHESWTKTQLAIIQQYSPQYIEGTFAQAVGEQRLRVDMRDYVKQLKIIVADRQKATPPVAELFYGQKLETLMQTEYPDPQWAVEGLLPEGCIILAGKPKHGKSYLALTWALAVAKQYKCMDHFRVTSGDVLCFSLEDYAKRVQRRLQRLYKTPSTKHTIEFFYDAPKMSHGFGERLSATLARRTSVRLVIIDTLRCIRDAQTEQYNLYQEDSDFIGGLNKCAQDAGMTILIVHHTRKAKSDDVFEEISGTGGLRGATSANMVLEETTGEADAMLNIEGKDFDHRMHVAMKRKDDGSWTYVGEGEIYQVRATKRKVLDAIRTLGDDANAKDVWQASGVTNYGTVKTMLSRMTALGEIGRSQKGIYFVLEDTAERSH